MEMLENFFRFFIIFFTIRTVFNIIFVAKPFNRQKFESNTEGAPDLNEKLVEKEAAIDMVFDEMCEVYLPKTKAYQVVEDDRTHYFCSWECRQKYIDQV